MDSDVMKLARLAFAQANRQAWWTNTREGEAIIARAILADRAAQRAAQAERMARLEEALRPFAKCADELDGDDDIPRAPDGEWAKFRLLTDDYRRARRALSQEGSEPS